MATVHELKPPNAIGRRKLNDSVYFSGHIFEYYDDIVKRSPYAFGIWMWLIYAATTQDCVFETKGIRFRLKPGQLVTTVAELSGGSKRGITRKQVRGTLDYLIGTGRILSFPGIWGHVITIVNWNKYASKEGFEGFKV